MLAEGSICVDDLIWIVVIHGSGKCRNLNPKPLTLNPKTEPQTPTNTKLKPALLQQRLRGCHTVQGLRRRCVMTKDKNGGQIQKERSDGKWRQNAKENTTETGGALRWGGGAPRFDGTKLREIKCASLCTYAMPLHTSKSEDPSSNNAPQPQPKKGLKMPPTPTCCCAP